MNSSFLPHGEGTLVWIGGDCAEGTFGDIFQQGTLMETSGRVSIGRFDLSARGYILREGTIEYEKGQMSEEFDKVSLHVFLLF